MVAEPVPRRWRRRLRVLGLSLCASLLLAELGVRLLLGVPSAERLPLLMMRANPHRGWEMLPGLHYTYQYPVRVNALGLRGPELADKAEGEIRVLALGDSLVYGQGVGDEETLPAELERALEERDSGSWTVINAGHRAYDTRQELALLEELGPRLEPDVVLLCWYWNDLHERDIPRTFENLTRRGEIAFDTGNRLEGWDRVRWQAKQLARRSALIMFVHDLLRRASSPLDPAYVDGHLQRLGRYLDRLRALEKQRGFDAVFVVIPDPETLRVENESSPIAARAAGLARERGLPVIELLPALEPLYRESERPPVIPFDGHYRPEANRAMAGFLAQRLLALGLPRRAE